MSPIQRPKLAAPGEGKTVMLFEVRFDYKVTSADSGGDLAALEVTIPPRTLVKPHNHSREDEFTVVLAGTVGARVGDQVVEAGTGASLVKPRGTPHAMWNASAEPASSHTGSPVRLAPIARPANTTYSFERSKIESSQAPSLENWRV